jgi:dTDP-4-amino-4,6-dideoxygalactose transaminase
LTPQHQLLEAELLDAIARVIGSNRFIMGPEVSALEEAVAAYCGVPHAVGVSSGTDALLVALMALGVGPGDLVITSTFSFFATAGVIARLGARPVFTDIDPETFNMAPDALMEAWDALTAEERARVRAVMPVHLFGQCADLGPIVEFAAGHGIAMIEDAAQALGAECPQGDRGSGRKAGSRGLMGCFSFFPTKNLGGFGDGGMVITSDAALAERLRLLRVHGAQPKYYHTLIGGNFRLDTLQAAVLLAKLPHLDGWHRKRQESALRYNTPFREKGLTEFVTLPISAYEDQGLEFPHIYNQYVIRASRRDDLQEHLSACGVGTAVYYPSPLHRQPCFGYLGYREGSLPVSELAVREVLALPIYPGLTPEQQEYVVECIRQFYIERRFRR